MVEYNKTLRMHVAGIIPTTGQKLDYGFPWPDCFQPIDKNLLAIEKSVIECAAVGCTSIWIIASRDILPLLQHRLGEGVRNLFNYGNNDNNTFIAGRKYNIPIYYVPTRPKDKNTNETVVWNSLYCAKRVRSVGKSLSNWFKPLVYYFSFPYGIFPIESLKNQRERILSLERTTLSYNGRSVKTGDFLPCVLPERDLLWLLKSYRKKSISTLSEQSYKNIPLEQRTFNNILSLKDVFGELPNNDKEVAIEVPWYHDISTWDGIRRYYSSRDKFDFPIERCKDVFMQPKLWYGVGDISNE